MCSVLYVHIVHFIMAGLLLLVVLMSDSFQEVEAQASIPPNLTVNPAVITERDAVTLTCETPTSVSVSQCDFYIASKQLSSSSSCVPTLTGTELLKMAPKSLPAEVKVTCSYTVQIDAIKHKSPDSNPSTIIINNLLPPTLTVNTTVIAETDSVTLNCQIPPSVSKSQCYFRILRGQPAKILSCLQTLTGTELLSLAQQSSPFEVEVTCFYLVSHPSPESIMSSIIIQTPPPELTMNRLVIIKTDSVTVNCVTPSSVSVTECFLYLIRRKKSTSISCEQTLTGTELLFMAQQSSPAEVELACFYTSEHKGGQYKSPLSKKSSIIIQRLTTCRPSASTSTSVPPTSIKLTTGDAITVGQTVKEHSTKGIFSQATTLKTFSGQQNLTTTDKTTYLTVKEPSTKGNVSLGTPIETSLELKILIVLTPGVGVIVGIILMGLALVCTKRRRGGFPRTNSNIDHGGLLPAGNNEAYNMATFVPGAERPKECTQPNTQGSEDESSAIYHEYATIPEEHVPDMTAMTYSTIKPH